MNKRLEKLNDYEGFVEKFKTKKTTDDCYTPPAVYDCVLGWAKERYGIGGDAPIVRPFWPGGDYEHFEYPEGCIVIDNPPFSILSRIVRFYQQRKIRFFLFAPSLTLSTYANIHGVSIISTGVVVTYENGARVRTGFVTNLEQLPKIIMNGRLGDIISSANKRTACSGSGGGGEKKKSFYPPCILTSVRMSRIASNTDSFEIPMGAVKFSRNEIGKQKVRAYGGHILVGEDVANEIEKIEQDIPFLIRKRMQEERKRMEEERKRMEEEGLVELTEEELAIVRSLTRHEQQE